METVRKGQGGRGHEKGHENVPFWVLDAFVEISTTLLERMAGTTRLELATSAVTGQRSNQLNYVPAGKMRHMVGGHGFEPRTFPV